MTRRELVRMAAAAAVPGSPTKFFTKEEFLMVDELSELIIPTDSHSPGARAAQVASYIDGRLAEAVEPSMKQKWRDGLNRINALSRTAHGKSFLEAASDQRVALLNQMLKDDEPFFRELKSRVARAYYTSKIGIHQELEYKGNVVLQEFVGYEVK